MSDHTKRSKNNLVINKAELAPALDVLQGLLEKGDSALAQDFKRYRLKLDWPKIVGPTVGEKCSPVAFTNGMLYVWVTNSTWMNQLFFVRRELLKKINHYAGRNWVKEIRFTQDRKDIPVGAEPINAIPSIGDASDGGSDDKNSK